MSALAAYRTAILAYLDDAALVRYTNDQVDAALRWALFKYSSARPLVLTYMLDANGEDKIAFPADFSATAITKVELYDADPHLIVNLDYFTYLEDEGWVLDTINNIYAVGKIFKVTYTSTHFIDALDSAAGTSVPAEDETLLQMGAAGHAILARIASRAENINLNADAVKSLKLLADSYLSDFLTGIRTTSTPAFADIPFPGSI